MEATTKFTPGPWTAESDPQVPERGLTYVEGPRGWTEQPIAVCDYGDDPETNEANARLIAAAPDLYAAGEAVVAAADDIQSQLDAGEVAPDDRAMWAAIYELRAALRRARGEG